jgi:hypothetical protein
MAQFVRRDIHQRLNAAREDVTLSLVLRVLIRGNLYRKSRKRNTNRSATVLDMPLQTRSRHRAQFASASSQGPKFHNLGSDSKNNERAPRCVIAGALRVRHSSH